MKIIVTAVGTTGDIQAFVALAEALKKAGHTVKVCSYDIYKKKFDKISVPFAAVGPAINEKRISEVRDTLKNSSPLKQLDYLVNEVFLYHGDKFYNDCIEASRGYHFGVCHSLDFIGQHVMIRHQIPWASIILTPGIIRTAYGPPLHFPNLGRLFNRFSWMVLDRLKSDFERRIEQYLFGLNGLARKINALGTASPHLNLVACSKHLNATYPDLPENFIVTGAWFVREGIYHPPQDMLDFVRKDRADAVFSFGSMAEEEGKKTAGLFLEAIELAKIRAIIQQGWDGNALHPPSPNALFVDFNMPHHYLFRQAKAVVHRGGAETTLEACKAGTPSITVPCFPDQKYWGNLLCRSGIGRKPVSPGMLSPALLAKEIQKALENRPMRERAEELGSKVRKESGAETAVKAIEDFVYKIK